jgi:rare lipoprotein A
VRVTHRGNGRSIIVRVNDRGPFVGERIIDLSYAAAVRLGMHNDGTALVDVEVDQARAAARDSGGGGPEARRRWPSRRRLAAGRRLFRGGAMQRG